MEPLVSLASCKPLPALAHQSIAGLGCLDDRLVTPLANLQTLSGGMCSNQTVQVFLLFTRQCNRMAWFGTAHGFLLSNLPLFLFVVNLGMNL
jgi:hypothetical protein